MDESTFETFEEELGQPLRDVNKPLRPARSGIRAEMYAQRRVREQESAGVQPVPKMTPREHPASGGMSLRKALSIQNLAQIETPWEGVTLNRCLIIAITILVLSSGLQRINETLRGRKGASEELTVLSERHSLIRRGKLPPHEPETSLWDTLFWWVADEDDDDEDSGKGKSKKIIQKRDSRGLRHRTLQDPRLLKKRSTTFTERRRGKRETDEIKERMKRKKEIQEKLEEEEKMEKPKKKAKTESKQKSTKKVREGL